jgi:hypothetical protein
MAVVAFYFFELHFLTLGTGIVVPFFVIGKSFTLIFIFPKVGDLTSDVVLLQCL